MKIYAVLLTPLLLGACVVPIILPVGLDKPLSGSWQITEAAGADKIAPQTVIAFNDDKLQFGIATNCNRLFGGYQSTVKNKILKFSAVASTRKACPDMETEQRLSRALPQVRTYRLRGNTLEMLDGQGQTLIRSERVADK
ncbi:META domain-containing protein [Neisseria musculi]|uniref:META domain protein n=1 Tax=Neisseria musculi TaxID=1815583 RepID=A0A7H1MEL5_9NEIS|nr:META domain-containing protein [Neisseria musculi]QNT60080.1 META domain protein [Neisseria musculi]